MRITRRIEFDAGHRVPDHESKCRSPHGHRYVVELEVDGDVHDAGAENGMVRDFGILKDALVAHVHDPFDHAFLAYEDDRPMLDALDHGDLAESGGPAWKVAVLGYVPTAENLAAGIAHAMRLALEPAVTVTRVTVWETPNCSASWEAPLVAGLTVTAWARALRASPDA